MTIPPAPRGAGAVETELSKPNPQPQNQMSTPNANPMAALSAILGNAAKPSSSKGSGIIVTDPALIALALPWLRAAREFETAETKVKQAEAVLKPELRRAWFASNAGRAKPESSLKIATPEGNMTASFAAQWYPAPDLSLRQLGVPADMVRTKLTITIKGDAIPDEIVTQVVAELVGVMAKHGCGEALSAKLAEYPRDEFAAARHRLTPEQNEAFEIGGLNTRCSLRA